jgi:hypothetical protein
MRQRAARLSDYERDAIVWHAGQSTEVALAAGIIGENERVSHWNHVAEDLSADAKLLAKMTDAYLRWHDGDERHADSNEVVLAHYDMLEPVAAKAELSGVSPPQALPSGDIPRMLAVAVASAALGMGGQLVAQQAMPVLGQRDPHSSFPHLPTEDGFTVRHESGRRRPFSNGQGREP